MGASNKVIIRRSVPPTRSATITGHWIIPAACIFSVLSFLCVLCASAVKMV